MLLCSSTFPGFAWLTIVHLLYHTSGISRYVGRELLVGRGDASLEERVRELSSAKLLHPVGEVFRYSNANYLVLGLVVQVVSGQPYGEYVREYILRPLQMHHSFVSEADALLDGMARGYRWWFGIPFPADVPYLPDILPAGFLLSSAEDMAHYLIASINGGQYGEASVLSSAGITELHKAGAAVAPGVRYGMGWVTESLNGVPVLSHCGDTANFHADMVIIPEGQWGIIALVNANNALVGRVEAVGKLGTWRIAAGVAGLLMGRQPPASKFDARMFYVTLNMLMAMLSALRIWSLMRLLRDWRRPFPRQRLKRIRRVIPLIYEFLVPLTGLIGLPKWTGASWNVLRLYAPDLAYWSLIMLPLTLAMGVLRAMLIFFHRSRETL
jgi:CubicO group peptidase (beta-lactamase class C family)